MVALAAWGMGTSGNYHSYLAQAAWICVPQHSPMQGDHRQIDLCFDTHICPRAFWGRLAGDTARDASSRSSMEAR
jgi:hypothetical protein